MDQIAQKNVTMTANHGSTALVVEGIHKKKFIYNKY